MAESTLFIALNKEIVDQEGMRALESVFDRVVITENRDRALDEMAESSPPVTAAIIGVKERIDGAVLDRLPELRILGSASVGADHIDLGELERREVTLVIATGVNAVSVAEHSLTMMLAQSKRILPGHAAVLSGADRAGLPTLPRELRGKRIGVLGAGNSAIALLKLLRGFDVDVRVWTRNPQAHPEVKELGAAFLPLDELIAGSDVLTVHLALTPQTQALLNRERLLSLPEGAIVVNVARREIIDCETLPGVAAERPDLLFAIDDFHLARDGITGHLSGSALYSPHIAGVTQESLKALQAHVIAEIVRLRRHSSAGADRLR